MRKIIALILFLIFFSFNLYADDCDPSDYTCAEIEALLDIVDAGTVTVTNDESTVDNFEVPFTNDNANLKSDSRFYYNPSTQTFSAGIISTTGDDPQVAACNSGDPDDELPGGIWVDDDVLNYRNCNDNTSYDVVAKNLDLDIWKSVGVSISGTITDGTNCETPDSEQIDSGPKVWFTTCSDNAGTIEFAVPMPENWDGNDIYVEMIAGSLAATPCGAEGTPTTVEFEVKVMCRGNDDLINSTWADNNYVIQFGTDIDTQYGVVIKESNVIAASGSGGDICFFILTRDSDDPTNDTCTQDIEVWGLRVYYQIDEIDERD